MLENSTGIGSERVQEKICQIVIAVGWDRSLNGVPAIYAVRKGQALDGG